MEEKPLRLLSELRSPQHRPPMVAFALVAVACAVVIATSIRFGPAGGIFPPLPSLLADAAIGRQERSMSLVNGAFIEELCGARTFGRLSDIEALQKMGLGRGGSLDNAIVVDGAKVLNKGGLRYRDEFVRHKMLDAVGDLALAGAPIIGRYEGVRAGHEMTNLLLRALFEAQSASGDAFEMVEYDRAAPLALGLCLSQAAA